MDKLFISHNSSVIILEPKVRIVIFYNAESRKGSFIIRCPSGR